MTPEFQQKKRGTVYVAVTMVTDTQTDTHTQNKYRNSCACAKD